MIYLLIFLYLLAGVGATLDAIELDKVSEGLNIIADNLAVDYERIKTPYLDDKKTAFIIVTLIWPILSTASIYRECKKFYA